MVLWSNPCAFRVKFLIPSFLLFNKYLSQLNSWVSCLKSLVATSLSCLNPLTFLYFRVQSNFFHGWKLIKWYKMVPPHLLAMAEVRLQNLRAATVGSFSGAPNPAHRASICVLAHVGCGECGGGNSWDTILMYIIYITIYIYIRIFIYIYIHIYS